MQKTIVQNICDDCSKKVPEFLMKFDKKDLCHSCTLRRVLFSASIIPVGTKCKVCEGKGYTKEFYGYNNDYTTQNCKFCDGSGQAQFKEGLKNVTGKNG
jgi:hypothetical protein